MRLSNLILVLLFCCFSTIAVAEQQRIDLICSWDDGTTNRKFIVYDGSKIFDTNLVRKAEDFGNLAESFQSSCFMNDSNIFCKEDFKMLEGQATVAVTVKLSRYNGHLSRKAWSHITSSASARVSHDSRTHETAICNLEQETKKIF
ncbi:hypothetical protein N8783_04325 [Alphaproteobacteria bacterium]|nr:hypothetical protein [Alphaproteobacteria bacterium]